MNSELWITEISEQSPCGEDLEYDAEFMALGRSAQRKPEQQYGETIIPAEEPDWRAIERAAEALLGRSKDIRVCVLLARACTNNHGLTGLAAALQAMHTLLTRNWDAIHPRLIIDGDSDPFVRVNAVAGLADIAGLVRDVRHAVLIKSAVGSILVQDAEIALDGNQSNDGRFSREQLIAICSDAQAAGQRDLVALVDAENTLKEILKVCDERLGAQYTPDTSPLSSLLSMLVKNLVVRAVDARDSDAYPLAKTDAGATGRSLQGLQETGGIAEIRTREDAMRVLDTVCRYLERSEPTNPAPLLIKRAQRLMSLSFMDIIKELTPDSMGQIEVIAGIRRD